MSEYKYACPVCGQHMRCDSSQAGTVMECPTCFQKITAPQAPAAGDGQKFVLTGTKVGERPLPKAVESRPGVVPVEKRFPIWILILISVLLAAGGGIFYFGGKHFGGKNSRLPTAPGWLRSDIGAVGAAGSASEAKGVFTISASGADIWRRADGFHCVYQPLNGDGSLSAQVLNLKNTDEWAKAGVMIRETTNANSAFALASIRSDGQAQIIWRSATGEEAAASAMAGGKGFPKSVKIVRSGNAFSAYYRVNAGDGWLPLGTLQTINMAPGAQIGLIVCAHHDGLLSEAQFDQVTLQTNNQAGPAAAPPAVPKLIAPPANDTNWTLTLDEAVIPNAPVAGRIHGQDFIVERAAYQNGALILRQGTRGPVESGVIISFSGAQPEALAGQTINVSADTEKAAPVSLRWKDANGVQKGNYDVGYALRLEFGAAAMGRLPGKIYLCTPDAEKSYLMGTFNAYIIKPKPKTPAPPRK